MSVLARNLRLGALVAALAGALALASAGTAAAARLVTSDTISFKGVYGVGLNHNLYESEKCSLKSDGETTVFPCEVEGGAFGIGGAEVQGDFGSRSSDGEVKNHFFRLLRSATSKPPNEIYTGTASCEEEEETEPGSGTFVTYPCQAKIKLTFNTGKHTVTGGFVIREESTQP
jgi:hypothetical protein